MNETAKTLVELSGLIGVDRMRLATLRHRPDAPPLLEDGTYDIESWRDFLDGLDTPTDTADPHAEESRRLKNENLRLRNAITRYELMQKQGSLMTMQEHLGEVREIIDHVKQVFANLPARVALLTTDQGICQNVRALVTHVENDFRERLLGAEARAADAERLADEATPTVNEVVAAATD